MLVTYWLLIATLLLNVVSLLYKIYKFWRYA